MQPARYRAEAAIKSAIVLGGGIAGASATIALLRAGWQVNLYERATQLAPVGAALSVWPNAMQALDRLGLAGKVRAAGMPFTKMLVADRDERPIIPARRVDGEALIITRAALQAALIDSLPPDMLMLDHEAIDVDIADDHVRTTFADGQIARADILIDAGGLRSAAADASDVSYRGYGGVVALSDGVAGAGLDGLAAEYWGWRERFGLFELPDRRRYWFYMRDQPVDAPPPSYDHIRTQVAGWTPALRDAVAATPADRLIPIAIHARSAPRRLGEGRLIRVGDAAHAMEPNLGQGACQAIEDAVALGAVARAHQPRDMLREFERLRLKRVSAIVRRAAEGKYGAHGRLSTQWAMRTFIRLLPASVSDGLARSIQTMPPYQH